MSAEQKTGLTVIVLAAGGGTRMKSKTMKVLHPIAGRSMIGHVLTAAHGAGPARGSWPWSATSARRSARTSTSAFPDVVLAVQDEQHGTGHAVRMAVEAAAEDGQSWPAPSWWRTATPRCSGATRCASSRPSTRPPQRAVSILSGIVADPFGYGRVLRNDEGDVEAIVEEKDATPRAARGPRDQLRDPGLRRRVPRAARCRGSATTTPRASTTSPTRSRSPARTA